MLIIVLSALVVRVSGFDSLNCAQGDEVEGIQTRRCHSIVDCGGQRDRRSEKSSDVYNH